MYICYITWYITGCMTLIIIPDLQQPARPGSCAGTHKYQPQCCPPLLQAPLQGHCTLLPTCRSPLLPPGLSFTETFLGWPLP